MNKISSFLKTLPFPYNQTILLVDIGARWGTNPLWPCPFIISFQAISEVMRTDFTGNALHKRNRFVMELNNIKVLVTGAGGFIGGHLVERCLFSREQILQIMPCLRVAVGR
jgi:hypothetical protein